MKMEYLFRREKEGRVNEKGKSKGVTRQPN